MITGANKRTEQHQPRCLNYDATWPRSECLVGAKEYLGHAGTNLLTWPNRYEMGALDQVTGTRIILRYEL